MWSSFTITSPDPPHLLTERLAAALNETSPYFRGVASTVEFEVTRIFWPTERGFPVIAFGRFDPAPDGGTLVRVRTRPGFWTFLSPMVVAGALLLVWFNRPVADDWFLPWFLSGVMAFFLFVVFISTAIEEDRCRRQLERILNNKQNTAT